MPKRIPDSVREEALRLRVEGRLSISKVCQRLGVSRGTVSGWLKTHPLEVREIRNRMVSSGLLRGSHFREPVPESRLHQLLGGREPDRVSKGRIAEAAVLLRVLLRGWGVYSSTFDGAKFDWIVNTGNNLVRLQVKSMSKGKAGSPFARLRCAGGRGKSRKYREGEFDFVVGYDLFTDMAYVWSWAEVKEKSTISAHFDAAEMWDKIQVL